MSDKNSLALKMEIAKFSVHVSISIAVLLFSMSMLLGDFAGQEYRPIWSGLIGTIVGVWIKKPRIHSRTDGENLFATYEKTDG